MDHRYTHSLAGAGVHGIREWWQLPEDRYAQDDEVLLNRELELWSRKVEINSELMAVLAEEYCRRCRESGRPTYAEYVEQAVHAGTLAADPRLWRKVSR